MVISFTSSTSSILRELPDVSDKHHRAPTSKVFHAEEFLHSARERARSSLTSFLDDASETAVNIQELSYLLRTTRALITMNTGIWERCKANRSETFEGVLAFSRVSIPQVKTTADTKTITFQIETAVTSKDFGAPPPLPRELSELLAVPLLRPQEIETFRSGTLTGFPDYATYLDRATLLRDESLVPFLVKLKDHVENVHVFLGSIEAWLMDPLCQVQFLEDTFDAVSQNQVDLPQLPDLIAPCAENGGDRKCCTFRHPDSSLCLRCKKPYKAHHRGMSRHGTITHICDYHSRNVGSFPKPIDNAAIQIVVCRPCCHADGCIVPPVEGEGLSLDLDSDKSRLQKMVY